MYPPSSEVQVPDTRRIFVKRLGGVTASLLLLQESPPIPHPRKRTEVDPPMGEDNPESPADRELASLQRMRLQQQEKEFRQTMERLYTRVGDLKSQVEALPSTQIFSVSGFKQTQQIEKWAKQLKNYARA